MAAVSTRHQDLILEAMPYTKHKLKAAQQRNQGKLSSVLEC